MTDLTPLEERIAHLTKLAEELSDVVAGQASEIAVLTRRVEMLMGREAEREAQSGDIIAADAPPPHW